MFQNPAWQYIASPRNYDRYVHGVKHEINGHSSTSSSANLKQYSNDRKRGSVESEDQLCWLPCKDCNFPENCVLAADYVAVARAVHLGKLIPGKAEYGFKYATIPVLNKEIAKLEYQVLVNLPQQKFYWKKARDGLVPRQAVPGGTDFDGEPLFIGRLKLEFSVSCGKVKPSHQCAYLPLGGQTRTARTYEVLCLEGYAQQSTNQKNEAIETEPETETVTDQP